MPLILGANSASGGYNIANSLRFNAGSSDYLTRTPATTGTSRQIMTFSFWTKRSGFETDYAYRLFSTFYGGGASQFWIRFADSSEGIDKISIVSYDSGFSINLITTQVFRDPSAWYHVVVAFDTTQATSTNRVKLYINGSQVTSFSTSTYPSQNYNLQWNVTQSNQIGANGVSGNEYYNGYMSEIYFIDGQQLTPSSFGETDEDSGIWKPKAYTGSYGTNGFYLKFANSASLGTDSSGNGNNFTVNNLTSVDQSTDTPTNNFATLNPLIPTPSATWTQGNLRLSGSSDTVFNATSFYTIGVSSGKWYTEVKYITAGTYTYNPYVGVAPASSSETANLTASGSQFACIRFDNEMYANAVSTSSYFSSSISVNDIIQVALDMDNGKVWFGKNGTFVGSPTAGTGQALSGLNTTTMTFGIRTGNATLEINAGSPNYSANSYTDSAGIGNFSYAVPSGYYALCTKNLANFG